MWLALSRVVKMAAAALQESPEWSLPRLRSSFGFEVRRRPKSHEEARTKSRVALRRPSSVAQDDYRHLKTKNKTDDEKYDKDTGAQHTNRTPPTQKCSLYAYDSSLEFFDVKFYPYDPDGAEPVFAAVSKKHVRRRSPSPQLHSRLLICLET